MNKHIMKRIVGIVLTASVMFSDISVFASEAFADTALINDGVENDILAEEDVSESDVDVDGELDKESGETSGVNSDAEEEEAAGETGEGDLGAEADEKEGVSDAESDGEAEGKENEELGDETGEEPETPDKTDEEKDTDGSVSGNEVLTDELELSVNEDEFIMPEAESVEGGVVGHTIPLENYMKVIPPSDEYTENVYDSNYILPGVEPEKQLSIKEDGDGQDWVYALCSALESSFKINNPGEQISIDCKALADYLYSKNENSAYDKYGSISKDIVEDPGNGKGNIHTAMWAAATGYAVVTEQNQQYRLKNIYMYSSDEKDRNKIKEAIIARGEVATSLYRDDNYFKKNSNAIFGCNLFYHYPYSEQSGTNNKKIEHTVTIVGWDDDCSYMYFLNPEPEWNEYKNGAWLVKDCYGYNGANYYWVSYYDISLSENGGKKDIKYYKNFYSFDFVKENENAHTYQYDGGSSCYMYKDWYCDKAVNIFQKAGIREEINAISFGTYTQNAKYSIQVYLDARPTDKENDRLVLNKPLFQQAIVTETYPQWGYYTVDLRQYADQYVRDREPSISNLDDEAYFAVEITIEPGENFQPGADKTFWIDGSSYDNEPVCYPDSSAVGQSYAYKNGKWVDYGQDMANWGNFTPGIGSNVRIKAHTQDVLALEAPYGTGVWMGETLTLQAGIGENKINAGNLQWSSDNEEIAVVSKDGIIIPKSPGYAYITAYSDEYGSDTIEIMVKDVNFTNSPLSLCSNSIHNEKRTGQIACSFYPSDYKPQKIEYSIKNEDDKTLLDIDNQGKVAVRNETTKDIIPINVTISDDSGTVTKEVEVNVYRVPKNFKIVTQNPEEGKNYEISVSEQLQFEIEDITPSGADRSDIVWRSSNAAVASVTSKGKVCALKKGTAIIKAVSKDDPSVEKSVNITVKEGISALSFSENYISLAPNESRRIELKVIPQDISNSDIEWSLKDSEGKMLDLAGNTSVSFDPDTMTISAGSENDIRMTRFRLYAECGGVISSCFIKINVPVMSLQLSFSPDVIEYDKEIKTSAYTQENSPIKLYSYFEPETLSAGDVRLFYSSDNPDVARVTQTGEIIPVKAGSVNLTARTENGISNTVHLSIKSIYTEFSVEAYDSKIYAGGTAYGEPAGTSLYITTDDVLAHIRDFYWESSDENVAVVDDSGYVEAVSKGNVIITAIDKLNSDSKASVNIQVGTGVREIQADRDYIEIAKGCKTLVNYKVLPEDADWQAVSLNAGNSKNVICNNNEISAIKEGETTVYLESVNGIRTPITVCVKKYKASDLKIQLIRDGIAVDYVTTKGTKESEACIKAEAVAQDGSSAYVSQMLAYESSNPDIVQADNDGSITGINAGTAVIYVSTIDGSGLSKSIDITVKKADSGIKSIVLNHSRLELKNGEKMNLIAALLPENAPGIHKVIWKSVDEEIATVDADGLVRTHGYGRTDIIAETMDGRKSAKCEIRVLPLNSNIKLVKMNNIVLENRVINPDSGYQVAIYADDGNDYRSYCEFTSSNTNVCTINDNGLIVPAEDAVTGTSVITASVKNDLLKRKVSFKVKLTNEKLAADIKLYANLLTGDNELGVKAPLYLPSEFSSAIELQAVVLDRGGNFMEDCRLKWSVSDKKVISVKELKSGNANISIKGNGSCVLTCSIKKYPDISVEVPVYIYDRKPTLTEQKIPVNLLKNETVSIPITKCAGTEIEELNLIYIKKGKAYLDDGFDIVSDAPGSGQYVLNYNAEYLSKGNYIAGARAVMRFDNSEEGKILKEIYHNQAEYSAILEIPINVTQQNPKIKVKKAILNVFDKKAKTELEITSDMDIDEIRLDGGKNSQVTRKFYLSKESGKFYINARTDEKGTFQAVLQVYVKNYVNPIPIKYTIKTVANKPKLEIVQKNLFAYKNSSENADISFNIMDLTKNEVISQESGYEVSKGGVLEGEQIVVSGLNAYGKKKIELLIKNTSLWNSDISMKIPITVEKEDKIAVETSQNKLELNKKVKNDCASVSIGMKQRNIQVETTEVNIYDSANNLSSGIQIIPEGNNIFSFRLQDHCNKGKYKAVIKVKANDSEYTKSIAITVKDVQPNVKVKLKGSIDLYNRLDTYMTGTVTVSNAADKITDVTSARDDFAVEYCTKTEEFKLMLKPNSMVSNKKQTVILNIYLNNGAVLRKSVNVNLKQSQIRWEKLENTVLYKSMGNRRTDIPIEAQLPAGADVGINIISVPKGIRAYSPGNGRISVYIDNEHIKPGKYKIKAMLQIYDIDGMTPMYSKAVKKDIVIQVK